MSVLGLYSFFEDKWYDLLESIDKFVPIISVTDKIDGIIPSFILFLVIILLILGAGVFFFISQSNTYDVELTVQTLQGQAIEGALVSFSQTCRNNEEITFTIETNNEGKASFSACNDIASVNIIKENFLPLQKEILFTEKKASLSLSPKPIDSKEFFAKIVDNKGSKLSSASLELICAGGKTPRVTLIKKTDGYTFTLPSDCTSIQLKATATGYDEKTVTVLKSEESKTIILTKINQKGTAIFYASSPEGGLPNTQITLTDSKNYDQTILLNASAQATVELDEGSYTYSAFSSGQIVTGQFSISASQTKDVRITFSSTAAAATDSDNSKNIFIKVLDQNSPIPLAELKLFISNGRDTNLFYLKQTDLTGVIGPEYVYDTNATYYGVIKARGYRTKVVQLNQIKKTDPPQVIQMQQGGYKLRVTLIDDLNKPVIDASTKLYLNSFDGYFDKEISTDRNGVVTYSGLSSGTYKIVANTSGEEGALEGVVVLGDTNVTMVLIKSKGSVTFTFLNDYNAVTPMAELQKRAGQFVKVADILTSSYRSPSYLYGTKLRVVSRDEDYFPYEGFVYEINKLSLRKTIYLTTFDELFGTNPVQVRLRQIYDSNPITGDEVPSTRILAGKTYYMLFDLFLTNEATNDALVDFYSGKIDSNDTGGLKLDGAYSIEGYSRMLAPRVVSTIIDPALVETVDSNAKQLNVILGEQSGSKQIPILIKVNIDENAQRVLTLNFQGIFGEDRSIAYSKEFILGDAFCLGKDCPEYLFSNYLKRNDGNFVALGDEINTLQIGDNYTIRTIAKNNTEKDVGLKSLVLGIESKDLANVSFGIDNNYTSKQITLAPLAYAEAKEFPLHTVSTSSGIVNLYKAVLDAPRSINNIFDKNPLRFAVKNKKTLAVNIYANSAPNSLYERAYYDYFTIEVKYNTNEKAKAIWRAFVDGQENFTLAQGITDSNGYSVSTLDLTNISKGTKIIFLADDDNGSIQGRKEIIVSSALPDDLAQVPNCVKIKLNGADYDVERNSLSSIDVTQTISFKLVSECDENVLVTFNTDLTVSPYKQFRLDSLSEQQFTLSPAAVIAANGGMLGAYPVEVASLINGRRAVEVFDVILSDRTSCFDLNQAIFDLRTTGQISSTVTNKCFAGRKDNFYPQMNISTNSVYLSYHKPGNPEFIDFNAMVIGSAIESQLQCGILSSVLYAYSAGNKAPHGTILSGQEAEELNFQDFFQEYCEDQYYTGDYNAKPEPDSNLSDPSVPLYRMPNVRDYTASRITAAVENARPKNASFKEVNLTTNVDTNEFPYDTRKGNYGSILKNTAIVPTSAVLNAVVSPGGQKIEYLWDYSTVGSGKFDPEYLANTMKNSTSEDRVYNGYNMATNDRWLSTAPIWSGEDEEWDNKYITIDASGPCDPCKDVNGTDLNLGKNFFSIKLKGDWDGPSWEFWDYFNALGGMYLSPAVLWGWDVPEGDDVTTVMKTQFESLQAYTPFVERRGYWSEQVHLRTLEGSVQKIGKYSASPLPKWTNIDKWGDRDLEAREGEVFDNYAFYVADLHNNGLINPESVPNSIIGCVLGDTMCERNLDTNIIDVYGNESVAWVIRPELDPLVEYDSTGKVMYYIPQDTIPGYMEGKPTVRMFLKNGNVYAEYIGIPEIESNNIDFNITNVNQLGQDYAILTVGDWIQDVNGLRKETKSFQVKLKGNPSNCYATDGTFGATGPEFVPKVFFNWDWNMIGYNQCDSKNPAATYCDGTQFTISFFKRLQIINDYLLQGREPEIPKYTSFYAYLIKDNYSQSFLDDFDEYYSTTLLSNSTFFNSTEISKGYDQFIYDKESDGSNRINFFVRDVNGTITPGGNLPSPGLYRVEIRFELDNTSVHSIMDSNSPNAKIDVTFILQQPPKNDNIFYWLPFDGQVGKKDNVFARKNYGASVYSERGTSMPLNNSTTVANAYTGANARINFDLTSELLQLNDTMVLSYSKPENMLTFAPSKPIPVIATITSGNGKVAMKYMIDGGGDNLSMQKRWTLNDSTMGQRYCVDFENQKKYYYIEPYNANGNINGLEWDGTKQGTIKVSSVFFVPNDSSPALNLLNKSDLMQVAFKTYPELTSNGSVQLSNNNMGVVPESMQDVFDAISDRKLCVSQNAGDEYKVWWNKDYLDALIAYINDDSLGNCFEN